MPEGLLDTLDLLRKVLALEVRQGYHNRAATGGLLRFFELHFSRHDYDEARWIHVERILAGLRRYETRASESERHAQIQIILREAAACTAAIEVAPLTATSPGHQPTDLTEQAQPAAALLGPVGNLHHATASITSPPISPKTGLGRLSLRRTVMPERCTCLPAYLFWRRARHGPRMFLLILHSPRPWICVRRMPTD